MTELPDGLTDLTDDEKNLDYLKEKARFLFVNKIKKDYDLLIKCILIFI